MVRGGSFADAVRAVDPRPIGLMRIAFGLCLLALVWETAPLATYLFSDEGLLPSAAVAEARGPNGRWSLLYLVDHPAFVYAYLLALASAAIAMTVGWHTRVATVLAWFLLAGMLRRGDAHWGGEQVFTGFLFVLMFADSGAAYSLDSRGRVQRRISGWPQMLIVFQLALAYAVNGWMKTGPTWIAGDTLALSMHLDRYARIDWHPVVTGLGTGPLRLATWAVLWWERLFPLVLVGMWLRATGSRWLRARVAWLVDPRPWLIFGLVFHAIGVVLFELGAFVGATVSAYVLVAAPIDPQPRAPEHPPLPRWAWTSVVAIIATMGAVSIASGASAWWYVGWIAGGALLYRAGLRPLRRLALGLVLAHHACALLLWQTPKSALREPAREMVEPWMDVTYTRQLWSMFAPNGPTRNQTLRTTVVVGDERHDLRTELEHDLRRPYLLHDRWRKVDEGVSGYRSNLAPWHARFVCRQWALDHDGEVPTEVVLERVVARFAPDDVADREAWFWAHAEVEPIVRVECAESRFGVPEPEVLARHGLSTPRARAF
jgi:hypothetical protein